MSACPSCSATLELGDCPSCGYEARDPRLGLVLDGKYRIDTLVGRGGMGRVYAAKHLTLGADVAVKFLSATWAGLSVLRARFRREAFALAKLRHPGVVSVLDFGEHDDELYIVMELVAGTPLSMQLSARVPMGLPAVGAIFDQILQVLEAAHALGIVHRDIKPDNVMLVPSADRVPRVKLLDFGIAYVPSEDGAPRLTETGTVQGTPHYMSPEQCRGADVGPPSDVYSAGVMLFEALAGAAPFDAEEATGLMVQHLFVEPPRIVEVGRHAEVSVGLERVVRRALAKRQEERPTAAQLRDELGAAIRGTDPDTLAATAALERQRMAALSRGERAPTGPQPRHEAQLAPTPLGDDSSVVVLWMPRRPRAILLRDTLAVNEINARVWSEPTPPEATIEGRTVRAVVVLAEPDGDARTRALRSLAHFAHTAVLVIDVLDAARTAGAIRAGASDVALAAVGDEDVQRKLKRLLRRSR